MKRILSILCAVTLLVTLNVRASEVGDQMKKIVNDAIESVEKSKSIEEIEVIATKLGDDITKISESVDPNNTDFTEAEASEVAILADKFETVATKKITEFGGALAESEYAEVIKDCVKKAISNMKAATSLDEVSAIANKLEAEMNEITKVAGDEDITDASVAEIEKLTEIFTKVAESKIEELAE